MAFLRSLSDSKSPKVCRTLVNILTDLNNAILWMIFTPLLSWYFQVFQSHYQSFGVIVPKTTITIGITSPSCSIVVLVFLQSLDIYLSFNFLCGLPGRQIPQFGIFSFFLLIITRSGGLAEIR